MDDYLSSRRHYIADTGRQFPLQVEGLDQPSCHNPGYIHFVTQRLAGGRRQVARGSPSSALVSSLRASARVAYQCLTGSPVNLDLQRSPGGVGLRFGLGKGQKSKHE